MHPIEIGRLHWDSAEKGLLYDALLKGLARNTVLTTGSAHRQLFIRPEARDASQVSPIRAAVGAAAGEVSDGTPWAEGCSLRLNMAEDRLWLTIDPRVVLLVPDGRETSDASREFQRERSATRYNRKLNELIEAGLECFWATRTRRSMSVRS